MIKKQHYMTPDERQQLEALRRVKIPVARIAKQLGFCRQTIYNEIALGTYATIRKRTKKIGNTADNRI